MEIGVNTDPIWASSSSRRRALAAPASDSSASSSSQTKLGPITSDELTDVMKEAAEDLADHHCLVHDKMNAHPDCMYCQRGKAHRGMHRTRSEPRLLQHWGDLCTVDHVGGTDRAGTSGVGRYTDFLSFYDFGTRFVWAQPQQSKAAEETVRAFRTIMGPETNIQLLYCDNHESLKSACKELDILRRPSQPGDPKSNGVIEGLNHRILSGARSLLIQAGLPYCWWPYAVRFWCFLKNLSRGEGEMCSYQRRYG